jgi:CrcB protein
MNQLILVFVGGGLGSLARFGAGKLFTKWSSVFPFGTLTANIIACFIIGVFAGWSLQKPEETMSNYRAFVAVGFCGGFSTFSSFTFETIQLISNNRFTDALTNVLLNMALCAVATLTGLWLMK